MNARDIFLRERKAMSVALHSEFEGCQPPTTAFTPFPPAPLVQENDLYALIEDFFGWLEIAWKLPVLTPSIERPPLPQPVVLAEVEYTISDFAGLLGHSYQ